MGGFFKMDKDLFDNLFGNVLDYRLMSLILRNAVYKEEGVLIEGIHVKRGQWVRSYRKLAEDLKYKEGRGYKKYSHQAIQKAMKRLESLGYIKTSVVQLTDRLTNRLTDRLTLIEVIETQENQGVSGTQDSNRLTHQLPDQLPDRATKTKKEKEYKNNNKISTNDDDFWNHLNSSELTEEEKLELEIENRYQAKRNRYGFPLSEKDRDSIRRAIKEGFSKEEMISGIDEAFRNKSPDDINSFEYCLKVMRSQRNQKKRENIVPFRKQEQPILRPNASAYKKFVFND
jgi:hypothetical protein